MVESDLVRDSRTKKFLCQGHSCREESLVDHLCLLRL
jgi:hypothetical protein